MNSYSCSECNAEVTAAQLRGFEAVRCSSLCRRTFHTACVDLPEDAIRLLTNMPNLLWQCDRCVVSNDSYSKIDEELEELHDLKSLYMDLNSKFLKAFPNFTTDSSNVSQRKKVVKPLAPPSSIGRQANHADLIPPAPVSTAARNHAKSNRNKRQIVGQAPNCELLEVVPSNKFLHIGRFRAHVKSDSVCGYVANKLGVNTGTIICKPLVKNGVDVATLEFVNFKLGIPEQHFQTVFSDAFWPNPILISRFIHRDRPIVNGNVLDLHNHHTLESKNPQ